MKWRYRLSFGIVVEPKIVICQAVTNISNPVVSVTQSDTILLQATQMILQAFFELSLTDIHIAEPMEHFLGSNLGMNVNVPCSNERKRETTKWQDTGSKGRDRCLLEALRVVDPIGLAEDLNDVDKSLFRSFKIAQNPVDKSLVCG